MKWMPRLEWMLVAMLIGMWAAVGQFLLAPPAAHANPSDVITRSDVTAIVRALEAQAQATHDLAREVRDASGKCR